MRRTMIILSASSLRTAKSLTCNWWAASASKAKTKTLWCICMWVSAQLPEVRYTNH